MIKRQKNSFQEEKEQNIDKHNSRITNTSRKHGFTSIVSA